MANELKRINFKLKDLEIYGKFEALTYFFNANQQTMLEKAINDCWDMHFKENAKKLSILKEIAVEERQVSTLEKT